jgi:hypothetical protein
MKFKLLTISAIFFILFSCGNGEQKRDIKENTSNAKASTDDIKLEELKTEASRLRGGGSIKTVELIDRSNNSLCIKLHGIQRNQSSIIFN